MISNFTVGATFKILNEASPALAQILKQVRELNATITRARENLASLGTSFKGVGLTSATTETAALSEAWANVARNAERAKLAMGSASATARSSGAAAAMGGGGGNRFRPGGAHIGGASVPVGGTHVRVGGAAGVAVGALGFMAYQAAKYDDSAFMLSNHAGLDYLKNRDRFRKVLEDSSMETGYDEAQTSTAAQQWVRMMQDTDDTGGDNGVSNIRMMLKLAAVEARRKGTGLPESMSSMTGMAHMLRAYSTEDIEKEFPAFAILSTRNPMKLPQMEKAFSYAVPLLKSSMGLDPYEIMALSTTMARSGASNTKSGTWLANMFTGALPGTSMLTKLRFGKHEAGLKALGLVDDKGNPTWMTDGHLDTAKFFDLSAQKWNQIPVEQRAQVAQAAFGKEGARAFALFQDPAAQDQTRRMTRDMRDPQMRQEVANFQETYNDKSAVQGARTAMTAFDATMAELGYTILPIVKGALIDFKDALGAIRKFLPAGDVGNGVLTKAGTAALEYGTGGALLGLIGGPAAAGIAGLAGAVIGGTQSLADQYMASRAGGEAPGASFKERWGGLGDASKAPPIQVTTAPITLNLNLDSQAFGRAVSNSVTKMYGMPTGAPSADGMGQYYGGDHNTSDK